MQKVAKEDGTANGLAEIPDAPAKQERSGLRAPDARKSRISELLKLVKETAKAKGWGADTASLDRKNYRYATVSVWRQEANTVHEVTGTYEINCDDKISITHFMLGV
jgi:hypothetical protein